MPKGDWETSGTEGFVCIGVEERNVACTKILDFVWVGCSLRKIARIVVVQLFLGNEDEKWDDLWSSCEVHKSQIVADERD